MRAAGQRMPAFYLVEVDQHGLRLLEEHEQKLEALRYALVEGEGSGVAGPLDIEKIKRQAREEAGLASG